MKIKKILLQIQFDPERTTWRGDGASFARLMRTLALAAVQSATTGDYPAVFASVEESPSEEPNLTKNHHGQTGQAPPTLLRQPRR